MRPPDDKYDTTTNQKHAGTMGERRDTRRDRRGAQGGHDLTILGAFEFEEVKK
jgi:hypothetical protein